MTIIAIGNEKGGVLKTTTVIHFADRLMKKENKTVVIVDIDTQNSIEGFYSKRDDYFIVGETIDLLKEEYVDYVLKKDKINIFKGGHKLSDFDKMNMKQAIDRLAKLKDLNADVVIIDLPPTTSNKVIGAIANSDGVFIPTDFSRMANEGVRDIFNKIKAIMGSASIGSSVVPLAIIATMIDGRDEQQKNNFKKFLTENGNGLILKNRISLRPKVKTAIDNHQLIWEVKAGDPRVPRKEMLLVIDEMINKIKGI